MNNGSSSNSVLVGILIVVIIAVVGFLAYKEGYFKAEQEDTNGIELQIGGDNN
ncbi:MAG: hypothetical protein V4690_01885 [Patescibacteria group bacterium]